VLQRYNARMAERMKIKPINKMQKALNQIIKISKFVWRHFFVMCVFILLLIAFVSYPEIDWQMFGVELIIAIFLDWLKTKDRASNTNNSRYHQVVADSFRKHSEWANNPAKIGSPANHLYNLGYNPGKHH
jgi:hypothetical protein